MAQQIENHEEVTPREARQGGLGTHVFVIWGISTLLAAAALGAFFMFSAAGS